MEIDINKSIELRSSYRPTYSDLDPMGHMNTERYLGYFLRHRFEASRDQLGINLKYMAECGVAIVIKKVTIEFKRPLIGDAPFNITSRTVELSETEGIVKCEMKLDSGQSISFCELVMVSVHKDTGRPMGWNTEFILRYFNI